VAVIDVTRLDELRRCRYYLLAAGKDFERGRGRMMLKNQFCVALVGGSLVAIGVLLGSQLPNVGANHELSGTRSSVHDDLFGNFQRTLLHASSASTDNSYALATGPIDEEAEGVFVMDFQTGVLHCAVLNHRSGKFGALFHANVAKDFGPSKNSKYQLVTGLMEFRGSASTKRMGQSVAYVLDSASGKIRAYAVPWRREAAATGMPQIGLLRAIDELDVRNVQSDAHASNQ